MPGFRKNWGLWFLALSVVGGFASTLLKGPGGHYHSFTQPALNLWSGQWPYGVPFAGGMYFYSPACALAFFSLFAFFPPAIGQALFVAVSLAAWIGAVVFLLRTLQTRLGFSLADQPGRNLLCLMVSSELVGAVQATKLEILVVALALFAIAWVVREEKLWLAGVALGIGTQWKFQPLPLVGLLFFVLLYHRKALSFALGFVGAVGLLTALPFLLFRPAVALHLNSDWLSSLREYSEDAWMHPIYQHVFQTLAKLGVPLSLPSARWVSLCAGLFLAGFLYGCLRRWGSRGLAFGAIASLSLASGYAVLFSPLSQSNGFVLYTPLLLGLWFFEKEKSRAWLAVCGGAYFLVSIAYSDLVPRSWYRYFYDHAYKPVGVLIFLALALRAVYRSAYSSSSERGISS